MMEECGSAARARSWLNCKDRIGCVLPLSANRRFFTLRSVTGLPVLSTATTCKSRTGVCAHTPTAEAAMAAIQVAVHVSFFMARCYCGVGQLPSYLGASAEWAFGAVANSRRGFRVDYSEGMSTSRVAVITGAAQGIGRRTAERLGSRGYRLALIDLQPLQGFDAEALLLTGDVAREEDAARFAAAVQQHFGRADVLVNNAGISFIRPAEETAPAEWRRVLDVNLTGPFLLCREFGRIMLAQGEGAI